jgi:hypothetical protein
MDTALVPIPGAILGRKGQLFLFLARHMLRALLEAPGTRLAFAALILAWTARWAAHGTDWAELLSAADRTARALLVVSLLIAGAVVEEFAHAAVAVAKGWGAAVNGLQVRYAGVRRAPRLLVTSTAIRIRGDMPELDRLHITAGGPIAAWLFDALAFGLVWAVGIVGIWSEPRTFLLAVCLLVVLPSFEAIPGPAAISSDGRRVWQAKRRLGLSVKDLAKELLVSASLVVVYLKRVPAAVR